MSTTLRRLMKEAQELSSASSSPSPHFHAHPVSDSDFFDWHFTLAGPPEPSPYAKGIYHGRISLPPQYPLRPPSFRFLTPSGRFEVNREICLSISGHHEETWQPAWGIRTALTAIRSFMDGDAKGQVGGIDAKEDVRRELATRSREWRCDICSEGKTNKDILNAWREICKAKGVKIDEEGNSAEPATVWDKIPKGLKLGYRDEIEQRDEPNKLPDAQGEESSAREGAAAEHPPSSIRPTPFIPNATSNRLRQNPIRPEHSRRLGQISGTSVSRGSSANPTPSSDPGNLSQAAAQASTIHRQSNPLPHNAPATSTDGPWLDRAIVGVLVALVLMILKRIFLQ